MSMLNPASPIAALRNLPAPDQTITGEDLMRSAEELVPLLRERAAEVDQSRHVSEDTYRLLGEAGFIHALRPRKWGGLELDDHANAVAVMTLARGCASTAWVVTVVGAGSLFILSFPEEVHEEVWGDDTWATHAGNVNLNPNAKVERVQGGYRLSGQWGFGSGSDFTSWLLFCALAGDNNEPHLFLVRQDETTLLDDWNVTGLRGTNSQSMRVDEVFVPDRRVMPLRQFPANLAERRSQFPTFDNLWSPFPSPGRFPFSSVALGAGLGAADYFAENITSATRVATGLGGVSKLAEQEYVATEFAEAQGELEMARILVHHRSFEAAQRAAAHDVPTPAELAQGSRDNALICRIATRATGRIFALIGSKAGNPANPVSRAKRDIELASSHVGNNWRNAAVGWMGNLLQPNQMPAGRPN